jgi:hypothetical protein
VQAARYGMHHQVEPLHGFVLLHSTPLQLTAL